MNHKNMPQRTIVLLFTTFLLFLVPPWRTPAAHGAGLAHEGHSACIEALIHFKLVKVPQLAEGRIKTFRKVGKGLVYTADLELNAVKDFVTLILQFRKKLDKFDIRILKTTPTRLVVEIPDVQRLNDIIFELKLRGDNDAPSLDFWAPEDKTIWGQASVKDYLRYLALEQRAPLSRFNFYGHDMFNHVIPFLILPHLVVEAMKQRQQLLWRLSEDKKLNRPDLPQLMTLLSHAMQEETTNVDIGTAQILMAFHERASLGEVKFKDELKSIFKLLTNSPKNTAENFFKNLPFGTSDEIRLYIHSNYVESAVNSETSDADLEDIIEIITKELPP